MNPGSDHFNRSSHFPIAQSPFSCRATEKSISKMNELRKGPAARAAALLEVDEEDAGQRLDNFLSRILKGVPKSHVYRILRRGEVRVNSSRAGAHYRLTPGDRVRIPPIRVAKPSAGPKSPAPALLSPHVLLEDEALLVLDKPAGI